MHNYSFFCASNSVLLENLSVSFENLSDLLRKLTERFSTRTQKATPAFFSVARKAPFLSLVGEEKMSKFFV